MYSGSVIPDGIGGVKKVEKAILPNGTIYEISAYWMPDPTCSKSFRPPSSPIEEKPEAVYVAEPVLEATIVGDSSHISDAIIEPEEPNTDTNFHVARSVVGPNNGTIATCETLPYGSYQSEPPERNIVATTNKDDPEKIFSILPNHLEDLFVASSRELSEEQTLQLKNLLIRHSDAFAKSKNDLGCCDLIEHTIDRGDARPVKQNPRRLPLAKRRAADQEIKRMLEGGIIEPSKSPWSSTIVP
ncbi:unnamed protein product [Mytilus edulis]|uniref:Uncharacterized protein n=1 Tax=Mytilus edulis TaxID=6550 RepID=A0A8S3S604_MYTED|nr:unnamed protein product [Mytilus edulis]